MKDCFILITKSDSDNSSLAALDIADLSKKCRDNLSDYFVYNDYPDGMKVVLKHDNRKLLREAYDYIYEYIKNNDVDVLFGIGIQYKKMLEDIDAIEFMQKQISIQNIEDRFEGKASVFPIEVRLLLSYKNDTYLFQVSMQDIESVATEVFYYVDEEKTFDKVLKDMDDAYNLMLEYNFEG